ncbi:MAG: lipid A deacylase LpxR family protein [Phycisphaeraceae bacterium]
MNQPLSRGTAVTALLALMLCAAGHVHALSLAPDAVDEPPPPADQREHDPYVLDIYWENDGGVLKPNGSHDRYYTNGVALSLAHRPRWAEQLAPHMPFADRFGPARTAAGYTVGQLMFTPRRIEPSELLVDDRPYAGYLYAGVYWQRANEHTFDHFQLDLGLVGPSSLADHTQDWIHDIYRAPEPQGWRHQLRDEPTIQFRVRKKWRADLASFHLADHRFDLQWIPHVGVAAGTVHRYAEAGAMLRLGGNLPDDFGPGRVRDIAAHTGDPGRGWGAYGFLRLNARLVEHNLFFAGNTWKDSHSVDHEPVVGEAQLGYAVQYRGDHWAGQFAYSQVFQSDEFKGQRDNHAYATFALSLTYWF